MVSEASANADSDKKEREKVDKVNTAESMIFQTEKQLKEYGDKIPAEKTAPIQAALEELRTAHAAQDIDAIDTATAKMNEAWQAASQEMYAASQEGGANPNEGPTADAGNAQAEGNAEDDVQDVEFEEVVEEDVKK